jgi:MFS family permease
VLAAPLGRLADRAGRVPVFLMGQACMALVYAGVAVLHVELWTLVVFLLLHGAYYAATDGVVAALISGSTPSEVRASGLATLNTATSLTRLLGSVVAGIVWSWRGPGTLVALALAATVVALVVSVFVLNGSERRTLDTGTT